MSFYDNVEERKDLIHSIFEVLNDWKIDAELQALLVGLSSGTKARELIKIKNGKAFPDEEDFLQRALEILSIRKGLKSAFPGNNTLANLWVTTPSYNFNDRAPLEIMITGLAGLKEISRHLHASW